MTGLNQTATATLIVLEHTVPLEVYAWPLKGEFLRSATIVNTMIRQLAVFASEVTRVAREVGSVASLAGRSKCGR